MSQQSNHAVNGFYPWPVPVSLSDQAAVFVYRGKLYREDCRRNVLEWACPNEVTQVVQAGDSIFALEWSGQGEAALRKLEKAVSRAGKKKQDIQKEEITESRKKRLEEEKERERAQRLNAELRRAKMMRAFRERGYMHEAVIDGQQQKMLSATRNELREQAQPPSTTVAASAEYAAQQYAAAGATAEAAGGEAAAPAVDVQA